MGRSLRDKDAAVKMAGDAAKSAYSEYEKQPGGIGTYPTYKKEFHPMYIEALSHENTAKHEQTRHKADTERKINKIMGYGSGHDMKKHGEGKSHGEK